MNAIPSDRPLSGLAARLDGAPALGRLAVRHLAALGADVTGPDAAAATGTAYASPASPSRLPHDRARSTQPSRPARLRLGAAEVELAWSDRPEDTGITDEATAQAATGVMAVNGRRWGSAPRPLTLDHTTALAEVLAVTGLLAGVLAHRRAGAAPRLATTVERAGLLSVSQYLAAACAPEAEAVPLDPGGATFASADGTAFEVEALSAEVWARFWRAVGAPEPAVRAGWAPFQFRYATACSALPADLHAAARALPWERLRAAADASGAGICDLVTLDRRRAEIGAVPAPLWHLRALDTAAPTGPDPTAPASAAAPAAAATAAPLAGVTVVEAGRRIQAPLCTHLLGLLGARVVRVEPPGGDPLRAMPPVTGGVSARWLALNRGKDAVEIDIKTAQGRADLRDLVADADVFCHNWAPGKAETLGLAAADLAAANPRLVYVHTSGWADAVPDAPPGTDFMVQARSGLADALSPVGAPAAPSLMTLLDVLGGALGAQTVVAALLAADRRGGAVAAESSLLGAADTLLHDLLSGPPAAVDPRRFAVGFRAPLRTADGWVAPADTDADDAALLAAAVADAPTADALRMLRDKGLSATAALGDIAALPADPRFAARLPRDSHGAVAVPNVWSQV
ncbi:CoA transferase [Streptomonospora sp. S1-112]|uniref:CoA transferase n=1 Tax=Streptomonospora mangrovi TaxID=2883123 RepID=A0A9X3NSY0_9ACTN|nr:CoA transferase [Streptomonospora mangrovi]MDA0567444.1 CoA transferase [Streptomonospora mangrovi]